jgi:hypothetical protein
VAFGARTGRRILGWQHEHAWTTVGWTDKQPSISSTHVGALAWWEDRGTPDVGTMAIYFFPRANHNGRTYLIYKVREAVFLRILNAAPRCGTMYWSIIRGSGGGGAGAYAYKEIT